ncbi:MAG: phosphotriesterase family protein [Gaiellaceae bacterium]
MPIYTVLGPIPRDALGRTSMHEHLLLDARVWAVPSPEPPPADARVTPENLTYTRWNYLNFADNLFSDDPAVVTEELARARRAGAAGVVDLTIVGLGRRPAELPDIARESGIQIIVGCGFYVHDSHPDWLDRASEDDVSAFIARELTEGIEATGIRPALVGEIGTSSPVTPRERMVVRAAGRAAAAAGAAVNVHLDPGGAHALDVLELLVREGMAPDRIVFSHMDARPDAAYHRAVAESGAVLSFDTFGHEFVIRDLERIHHQPTDLERCELLARLVEDGFGGQLVLGCDCGCKATLAHFGGHGYEHLFRRIAPALERYYGVAAADLDRMLVETPRRLLDRPPVH